MLRREFPRSGAALAVAAELGAGKVLAFVPAHNGEKYDFGSGPPVSGRLNQAPFPQYRPHAAIPTDDVFMATAPSDEVVPNYRLRNIVGLDFFRAHVGREIGDQTFAIRCDRICGSKSENNLALHSRSKMLASDRRDV